MNSTQTKSTDRNGVLAGGNFITDYVKVIDHWPDQDTLASIRSERMSNGGGPYNVLKDLSRLVPGMPLSACGLIGNDANGDWILRDCQANQINTDQLHRTNEASTSYTDAMTVGSTGRRTFFHQRGSNALLAESHFDFGHSTERIFLLGYLMLLDSLDKIQTDGSTNASCVLELARESGLITAVDCVSQPGPDFREVVLSALNQTDILFINEFEIGQVIGHEVVPNKDAMLKAASELAALGNRESTIVLHAANGAVAVTKSGKQFSQAALKIPQANILGASGAGDAFAAGYLAGVHDGHEVFECLEFAVAAAAQSLTDPTPSDGMRTLDECLQLLDQFGLREF